MQEVQTQPETKSKCCGKNGGHRAQRRGKCGSSHKHEANAAPAGPWTGFPIAYARGLFQPVEGDVQEQRADHTTLGCPLVGRREPLARLENPGFQPGPDQVPGRERSERCQQP